MPAREVLKNLSEEHRASIVVRYLAFSLSKHVRNLWARSMTVRVSKALIE